LAEGSPKMGSVKQFYEKTAETYDKEYEQPYWRLYHEITWENMKRFLPERKKATILDAGGGTGYWAIRLAKRGYTVVLTDIAQNMLKVAKEKIDKEELQNKIETKTIDIRDMSCFPSSHFDMALAEGDPVSYCLSPEKAVRELARVVKPNSYVIASVDSKYSMISRLIKQKSLDELSSFLRTSIIKGDFRFQAFTPEELTTLFEKCGLKVVRIIGKPILLQSIPTENRDEIIEKEFKKLLKLELEFCDVPCLVGMGGHLEVVGIKQRGTSTT
jgi:ubiquinone/menaquinone biosynthesis C-methylase UbiE